MYYTYLIGWSTLNKYYYGVRTSKKATLADLWVTYFTSSKRVKEIAAKNGPPNVIQIRKIFDTPQAAILWESKVLTRLRVHKKLSDKWINLTNNRAVFLTSEIKKKIGDYSRGKTYEERYGIELANKLRQQRSKSNKLRGSRSEETKKKISETRLKRSLDGTLPTPWNKNKKIKRPEGWVSPNLGKVAWNRGLSRSEETKNKIKAAHKLLKPLLCPHCGFISKSRGNMTRHHFDRCKLKISI